MTVTKTFKELVEKIEEEYLGKPVKIGNQTVRRKQNGMLKELKTNRRKK